MNPLIQFKKIPILAFLIALALAAPAWATLPPGNTVEQWNKIAEDTVVGSARSKQRASFTCPTPRLPCTTPQWRSTAISSRMVHRSRRRQGPRSIAQ